jgi:hypothetical protein
LRFLTTPERVLGLIMKAWFSSYLHMKIVDALGAGLLQGSLKEVEALQEVKAELEGKTSLLYTRLMEDLTAQVIFCSIKNKKLDDRILVET